MKWNEKKRERNEHRLQRALRVELHPARQRARVDGDALVHDERAGPVAGGLAPVAANDAKIQGAPLRPRSTADTRGPTFPSQRLADPRGAS